MYNKPTKKMLAQIPRLYATEDDSLDEKKVYLKFFLGGWTWYIMEYDPEQQLFFGLTVSPMMPEGELGYISYEELKQIRTRQGFEVDREIHQVSPYKPKLLSTILEEDGVDRSL